MAKLRALISLEHTLAKELSDRWEAPAKSLMAELKSAILSGDEASARRIADGASMKPVADAIGGKLHFLGASALVFGASQLVKPKDTIFTSQSELPMVVDTAIEGVKTSLINNSSGVVRDACHSVIDSAMSILKSDAARRTKAADEDLADALNAAVMGTGKGMIDVGANLTTSRLVSYGFLSQAQHMDITEYEVSEVLDERTCPVCQIMHGQRFKVERAMSRLESTLMLTDPNDLRYAAPWPKQDKRSVYDLYNMDADSLQGLGFDAPPYHPMCRGILVPIGSTVPYELDIQEPNAPVVEDWTVEDPISADESGMDVMTVDDLTDEIKGSAQSLLNGMAVFSATGVERKGGRFIRSAFAQADDDLATYVSEAMVATGLSAPITERTMALSDLVAMQPLVKKSTVSAFVNDPMLAADSPDALPVVVYANGKNVIYDGNHRLQALSVLGVTHTKVKFVDLSMASILKHDTTKATLRLCSCQKCSGLVCD